MLELVIGDLDFIRSRAAEPSFDIWEEESGYHYYTQLVQAEALACGAEWLEEIGDAAQAGACRSVAEALAPKPRRLLERGRWLLPLKDRRCRRRSGQRLSTFRSFSACFTLDARRARTACSTRGLRPRWPRSKTCSTPNIRSTAIARLTRAPRWGATRATPITAATPGIWRRSRRPSSISNWRSRCDRAPGCQRASENARFRERLGDERSSEGRFRTRRYVHADGAGVHAAKRRSLGAIRSRDGRSDIGQTPGLELRRLHHRRREPPPGRPGHSRLRSLRDFLKPGVTIRLPNRRRSPKAWRISMLA